MECFYHDGRPAVGTCRSCLKGVCRACVADLGKGLACAGRCELAARDVIAMIDQGVRYRGVSSGILGASRNIWLGLAVVGFLVGIFVVVWGLSLPVFREISLLGIPFLLIAGISLRVASRLRMAAPSEAHEHEPTA